MKRLRKILVPSDLSEYSRCALTYGCRLAAEEISAVIVLHVANEFTAWEYYSEEFAFAGFNGKAWPPDRVLTDAALELNRFLEPSLCDLGTTAAATKRVVLGSAAQQILAVAEEEDVDLIIMSPRHGCRLRHWFRCSITERVTRRSSCPVLSITTLPPSERPRRTTMPIILGRAIQCAANDSRLFAVSKRR